MENKTERDILKDLAIYSYTEGWKDAKDAIADHIEALGDGRSRDDMDFFLALGESVRNLVLPDPNEENL